MSALGPDSIPVPGSADGALPPPQLDDLRIALRPPELPAPAPHDALSAAHRVMDLLHAERYRDAMAIAEHFAERTRAQSGPTTAQDRLELLRARLLASVLAGSGEPCEQAAAELVTHLRRNGHRAQAAATATVLLESGPSWRREARTAALGTAAQAPKPSGRRRGERTQVTAELLAVVRGMQSPALRGHTDRAGGESDPSLRWGQADPRSEVRLLRAALEALPTVRDQLLGDPEPLLMVRLAQALEAVGDPSAATTLALDVLERMDEGPEAAADPQRARTSANALLARTLGEAHPVLASHHAVDALLSLRTVDDPPLRIGLITDLLQALMRAELPVHASFTAGRLLSLQRTLRRDAHRTAPLLAVAAQRISAERYDAAWVPLEQARLIARQERDRRAGMEAARLAASIHERTDDARAQLVELRQVAASAHWLADDLATSGPERSRMVLTELQAQSLVMRRAMDLEETTLALSAAAQVERRTLPDGGRPVLPAELLWDHRVDALVGRFITLGAAAGRGEEGVVPDDVEQCRREALQAIDAMPPGHDARARYWAAYLDERHAALLAERGEREQAQKVARRAHRGWLAIDAEEDAQRVAQLVDRLAGS
ncbi:hypothetical protein [Brachybacterium muris]|uniref:Uncharacterized protein n=1 Tax=Brachybacterium muris UCD-AY4 TaxID=1249481 RepID=A0A022KVM7_9MICO|nr:hypothetical protein [Brachybacterium muris]EYT48727.1 hypothetical protein D641_0111015 [Brachybacterium muris UCD-AY4]